MAGSGRLGLLGLVAGFLAPWALLGSASVAAHPHGGEVGVDGSPKTYTRVLNLAALTDIEPLLDAIADRRVIFVGESHDRYEDHLNQLAVIKGLQARGRDLAIGMEFFQQPFQEHVDAYIAGEISEAQFLRLTEYFDRWRFDYRLYQPILRYAREQGIPVIALNLPAELTKKVGEVGIKGLDPEEQARIPADIERDDPVYRERIKAAFDMHPQTNEKNLDNFLEVQLLWDEGMAERAASYLIEHPEKTLVVLAGAGHLEYGQGIPKRVLRRIDAPAVIVLSGVNRELDPDAADYFLFPSRVELPAPGLLGVMLAKENGESGTRVEGFAEGSGAKAAGLEEGDQIVRVGEDPIESYADIRIALIDGRPGQKVPVEVKRERLIGDDETLSFEVELH